MTSRDAPGSEADGEAAEVRSAVDPIEIRQGWLPGSLGRVVELHGSYYAAAWGFGAFFEAKVARELAEFMARYDERSDCFWTATVAGRLEGSITIDGKRAVAEGAHLRWFIVSDAHRGRGVGHRLMDAAVEFCRSRRFPRIYLWTFAGLHAARHLYEKAGFTIVEEHRGSQWGTEVTEQRFERALGARLPLGTCPPVPLSDCRREGAGMVVSSLSTWSEHS
jgi:GNAT superfamily N-acetyltransferase